MTFPVHIPLPIVGPVHPHLFFDVLAYTGGFQLYLLLRRRGRAGLTLTTLQSLWLLAGAVLGAAIGAKLLNAAEHGTPAGLLGKTVVGGLLGGWAGVELAKWRQNVAGSTGGLVALPLCLGIAVGRVGCFLTGLADKTYGVATTLPWAVNFGDGVPRHPTQLYDVAVVALIAAVLLVRRPGHATAFRLFLGTYLAWRLIAEFLKPTWKPYLGLSAIQWACVIGVAAVSYQLSRLWRRRATATLSA